MPGASHDVEGDVVLLLVRPAVPVGRGALAVVVVSSGLWLAACGYAVRPNSEGLAADVRVVRVTVTPSGCHPVPGSVPAGEVQIVVTNLNAPTVSEVEIRTGNFSQVLGERENLVEGLSQTFELHLERGRYIVNCPGAVQQQWPLAVST